MTRLDQDSMRRHWLLDPDVTFLNHGSFGACPAPVLETQGEWRRRLERQPVQFFDRDAPRALAAARERLAGFLRADPAGLAWVPNATSGVNAVLRSLTLEPGDELITTDHEYNASANTLQFVAQRAGARAVVVPIPFPPSGPDDVVDRVLAALTPRTRLVLIDHVTSPTGMIWPLERLIPRLRERGVPVLVDGAHGPGMLDLDLTSLEPDYYTGNCHKWVCAPKGAAFLWVAPEWRPSVRPICISRGAALPANADRYRQEFDWVGTDDPTAYLSVPAALDFMGQLLPGGWSELRRRNRRLALEARAVLAGRLGVSRLCPDSMIGSLVTLPLPDGSSQPTPEPFAPDPLHDRLLDEHAIEVPVFPWPARPRRMIRVSAQIYNTSADYARLAAALESQLSP